MLFFDKHTKGFTFIELLIVSAIMMSLLALSAPFVTSLRSDLALRRTIRQAKADVSSTIGYALAGKSIASLSARVSDDPSLLPGYYGLYFMTSYDFADNNPYYYVEIASAVDGFGNASAQKIYQLVKEFPAPGVYLKEIRLRDDLDDDGILVDSAWLFSVPPFGKINIATGLDDLIDSDGYSFDPVSFFANPQYQFIDLIFQYKDDPEKRAVLSVGVDKVINIL